MEPAVQDEQACTIRRKYIQEASSLSTIQQNHNATIKIQNATQ